MMGINISISITVLCMDFVQKQFRVVREVSKEVHLA